MIPLRDNIPHKTIPVVTVSIIVANILVFLYQISLGPQVRMFFDNYAFIPYNLSLPISLVDKVRPFFTSMFLHASWIHLIGNMLFYLDLWR